MNTKKIMTLFFILLILVTSAGIGICKDKRNGDTSLLFKEALDLYIKGELTQAQRKMQELLEKDPYSPIAQFILEDIILKKKAPILEKKVKSLPALPHIEDEVPKPAELFRLKEDKIILEKRKKEEKKPLPELILYHERKEELPKEAAKFKIAYQLYKIGDYDTSQRELDKLLQDYPASKLKDRFLYVAAKNSIAKKDNSKALEYFRQLSEIDGIFKLEAMLELANTYAKLGNYSDAHKTYLELQQILKEGSYEKKEDIYDIEPKPAYSEEDLYYEIYLNLARLYKDNKDYQNAILMYDQAIDMFGKSKKGDIAYFELASLYEDIEKIRDFHKAYFYYTQLQKKYPDSVFFQEAKRRAKFIKDNFL